MRLKVKARLKGEMKVRQLYNLNISKVVRKSEKSKGKKCEDKSNSGVKKYFSFIAS